MNASNHGPDIPALREEIQQRLRNPSKRLYSAIAQVERAAREQGDTELLGRCDFWRACSFYVTKEHEKLARSLKKALYHLLRSDARETVASAFNLFGIEAQRLGCFDVAYHYLHTAFSFVEDNPDSFVRAIIDANMGDLLTEMGDPKLACVHLRRSVPVIRRLRKGTEQEAGWLLELVNLGLHCIYADDFAGARRVEKQLLRHLPLPEEENGGQLSKYILLFRAQLALADGNRPQTLRLAEEILFGIVYKPGFGEFTKDTYRFCKRLIDAKEWSLAGRFVEAFEVQQDTDASAHAKHLLTGLQIDYYSAHGNRNKLLQYYKQRKRLFAQQREDETNVCNESMEIMRLTEELRMEQERAKAENRRLRHMAETDALTALPNRYALNRKLEEAFHRAVTNWTTLGIGVVDIDAFKQYNDTMGHEAGDRCLRDVAHALQAVSAAHGLFCARYGGDEFVLLYEGKTNAQIEALEQTILEKAPVSITHGFTNTHPTPDTMMWSLFSAADDMLYSRKRKRRTG